MRPFSTQGIELLSTPVGDSDAKRRGKWLSDGISAPERRTRASAGSNSGSRGPWSQPRASAGRLEGTAPSAAQQLRLLRGELLLGEDALGFQLAQLLQLVDGRAGGGGGRRLSGLFGLLLFFLFAPALALPARHSIADRGRGAGDGSRARHSSK